jgi:choline monooxygenase
VHASLPWAWYSDPEVLHREQESIFRRAWQYAGHTGQVAEPGAYFTATAGTIPIVVTRDRDGALHAFLNVCRHRGFPVATGEGRRETLQCAYHAWTYGLDGSLRAAPRSELEPGFDATGLGLVSAAVDTWGPFVFVNPDAEAQPLAGALGPLPELLDGLGLDLDGLEPRLRSEFDVEANWKVVCENFLECYHCPVAHPGFSKVIDVSPDAYRLESEGFVSSQFATVREDGRATYDVNGEIERGQFHFLWPNVGINVFPGRPNISIGPINPLSPTRTHRFLDYFFAPDVDDEWVRQLLEFDDQVGKEDRELVEGVQRGVAAGGLEQGVVLERSEQLIRHFQLLTTEALESKNPRSTH